MKDFYAHVYVFVAYLDDVYIVIFNVNDLCFISLNECD
jgi:hypothetical protein